MRMRENASAIVVMLCVLLPSVFCLVVLALGPIAFLYCPLVSLAVCVPAIWAGLRGAYRLQRVRLPAWRMCFGTRGEAEFRKYELVV